MLSDRFKTEVEQVLAQREEIIRGFIAQHGFNPDEAEQVLQHTENGTVFYIRHRPSSLSIGSLRMELASHLHAMEHGWEDHGFRYLAISNQKTYLRRADKVLAIIRPAAPETTAEEGTQGIPQASAALPVGGLGLICRSYMYVKSGPIRDAVEWIKEVLASREATRVKAYPVEFRDTRFSERKNGDLFIPCIICGHRKGLHSGAGHYCPA